MDNKTKHMVANGCFYTGFVTSDVYEIDGDKEFLEVKLSLYDKDDKEYSDLSIDMKFYTDGYGEIGYDESLYFQLLEISCGEMPILLYDDTGIIKKFIECCKTIEWLPEKYIKVIDENIHIFDSIGNKHFWKYAADNDIYLEESCNPKFNKAKAVYDAIRSIKDTDHWYEYIHWSKIIK